MAARFINLDRQTAMFLPCDLREWVPEDHAWSLRSRVLSDPGGRMKSSQKSVLRRSDICSCVWDERPYMKLRLLNHLIRTQSSTASIRFRGKSNFGHSASRTRCHVTHPR